MGERATDWRMTTARPGGLLEEELTRSVIGAFFRVHRALGFGFLEQVYRSAMELELRNRGHLVAREVSIIVRYEGVPIAHHKLDMVVDDRIVVEIKATERLYPDASRQLFNYLRASTLEVGLLLHFGREAKFERTVSTNSPL